MSLVTSQDVQKLYRRLKENGRVREHPRFGSALSDTTINRLHAIFHQAMEDALHAHIIAKNPTVGATVPKASHAPKRVLTDRELDTFLDAVREDKIWGDFFYVELTTGLRRGEICGLMWSDFDPRKGTLNVSRTLHKEKGGRLVTGDTKTCAETRKIVLPPTTSELLSNRKKHSYSVWIFPNPLKPEAPMNPSTAYHQLKKSLRKTIYLAFDSMISGTLLPPTRWPTEWTPRPCLASWATPKPASRRTPIPTLPPICTGKRRNRRRLPNGLPGRGDGSMAKRRTRGDGSLHLRKDGRWEGRYIVGYDDMGLPVTKMSSPKPSRNARQNWYSSGRR